MGSANTFGPHRWCSLCVDLYEKARYMLNHGLVKGVAMLGTGMLCTAAEMSVGGVTGGGIAAVCSEVARKVINYIRNNGFDDDDDPRSVCRNLGYCP